MANNSRHYTEQQAQISKLFDEALTSVLKEASEKIYGMDALFNQWPEFEQAFLKRLEHKRADVVESVSGYDRHSRLRILLLSKLKALLAADDGYRKLMAPLRQRERECREKSERED